MRRYYGKVGFIMQQERIIDNVATGVWEDTVVEHYYYGDIINSNKRWQSDNDIHDDLVLSDRISIIADTFALSNCQCMKYAEVMGMMWKITSIEVQYPRLILSLGGKYNGQQARTACET